MYLYQLPSGLWRCQIAKRGIRESQTFQTKGAARAWGTRREAEILDGVAVWPQKTVADALARYLREVTPNKGAATFERVAINQTLREFPDLCGKQLAEVTTADLVVWRDARLQTVSGSTVIRYGALLRNVWTVAAEWGWCPKDSPWTALKFPQHNPPRERINGWREVRTMLRRLNYLTGRPPQTKGEQVAYAWLIALRTAMRASEVLNLRPEDVRGRVVTLRHHKTRHLTGRDRRVPISAQAARLLALALPFDLTARSLDALFRKARAQAGLDGFTFHDSRATATTLLSRRVDPLTLARITGHGDVRQLMVYYRESDDAIADRLSPSASRRQDSSAPRGG